PELGQTTVVSLNSTLGITQVYRSDYSRDDPPWIILGAQDVGTGALDGSRTNWQVVGGGDGGACAINPGNPCIQYLQANFADPDPDQRRLQRTGDFWQSQTDMLRDAFEMAPAEMTPEPRGSQAPMVYDPNNPSYLYVATNFLYRWVEPESNQVQGRWDGHPGN